MKTIYLFIVSVLLSGLLSCENQEQDKKSKHVDKHVLKEHLINTNKHLVKFEEQNIKDFIERYGYKMMETGSGLYYEIYKKGNGLKAEKGKIAELEFNIRLLNGETIYRSENKGIKEFLIGKGGVESGLEEGILLLHQGDKARFIIPSHLAFGLLGDSDKIPEKASLVYDVELIKIK